MNLHSTPKGLLSAISISGGALLRSTIHSRKRMQLSRATLA